MTSAIPILGEPAGKVPARSLVFAPRLPPPPKIHTGNPFTSLGDVVAECETCLRTGGKRYHVSGPRADVKQALVAHHREFHAEETSVILLNQPAQ